ncbi:MAG TPA: multifunctional oxoglutarate decarboxylase/oxoglutarate dehydrogenase thiamine pyrophosphate-binding subunit/dihydrolipoyllysine-residue succinyltransferase subunit [Thermoanaerobaculia bacterium]|nr:multifunctional oxoglutarate decarboxylase/oxoglutarate dehydrogenase thiamine pyrophosphate-binding subunit/dihydrolipoyllysine-residue succinyltransferase subunit [Thermoanaerobaculia bacterium]
MAIVRPPGPGPLEIILAEYGINADYALELYDRWRSDPALVDEDWREYFEGLTGAPARAASPATPSAPVSPAPPAPVSQAPSAAPPPRPAPEPPAGERQPIRGAALQIAQNMKASLEVPTATSQRQVAIKLLDENRRLANEYRASNDESKISFTHLVAWAALRALHDFPRLNDAFTGGPDPARLARTEVHLGIAVDVQKRDGSRSLLVPNIKNAHTMSFGEFVGAMDDVVSRARAGKLALADFQGTTVSLTNPGPMGTTASIARLMPGQGLILATGAIDWPAGFSAMAPEAISNLGISKVMTLSCTYDHRIIQGAESGAFLGRIEELLLGEHGFYEEIFEDLAIPHRPFHWAVDLNPAFGGADVSRLREIENQARVLELINAYRVRGHLVADIDPLRAAPPPRVPELDLETYGLTIWDLDREFITGGLGGSETLPLRKILEIMRRSYCGKIGVEYRFIQDGAEKEWLRRRIGALPEPPPAEVRKQILWKLLSAEVFEKFLHNRFLGQKRFSIEGVETLIPFLDQLVSGAGARGIDEITIGMSHRGRLNVIANVIGRFCERIFASFEGVVHPDFPADEGDVKYHRGAQGARDVGGRRVSIELVPNPSHLEFVDAVVEGIVRARQDKLGGRGPAVWNRVLPVLVHGDAAFAGQGIVAETLNLAQLRGYRTGGTIHVVVNNQIGFTTPPGESRSSLYSTDMAKINQVPIFHVNADEPEAAHRVLQIALDYRQEFHKDAVVDLIGFRRHGHNEGDEPSYTQPVMYRRVREHPGVFALYAKKLVREKVVTEDEVRELEAERLRRYEAALDRAKEIAAGGGAPRWDERPAPAAPPPAPETAIAAEAFDAIGSALAKLPRDFHVNPKVATLLARRGKMARGESPVDWASAEAFAFGSLLREGTPVRLSGEDTSRGTFSQRHMVLHDTVTGARWTPLESVAPGVRFSVFDSALSEAGVLGFEYGYSVEAPETLTLWEAQYGDFVNAAQVIVDQFIVSGREKWAQPSRLVLLLPHGQEGQGPEHSSARPERFLALAVDGNLQVCQPSTPAQYFHLLRRQVRRPEASPLVVLTPKSLLRLAASFSDRAEMTAGRFEPVLGDRTMAGADRVILCSGKVSYELAAAREKSGARAAIVRVEQLAPFPAAELRAALDAHRDATDLVWVQEEPRNMGAWAHVSERFADARDGRTLRYVGRPASASPATGSAQVFHEEQEKLVQEALS